MDTLKKTIWYDTNSEPPKNYIWMKADGKAYEYNVGTKQWEESKEFSNASLDMFNEMTEEEKAQVRKDLGLYYEEPGTEEKTVGYPDAGSVSTISGYTKLSDDNPTQDDIIKVITFLGEKNPIFTEQQDGYLISIILDDEETPVFRIVSDDSQGNEIGIYVNGDGYYTYQYKLVYNGETMVVSKIDEKFLPEQKGGYTAHASQDFVNGMYINFSTYFSNAEDIEAVLSGEATEIVIDNTPIKYILFGKSSNGVFYVSGTKFAQFSGAASFGFITVEEIITTEKILGLLEITRLPDQNITTIEELNAIGITQAVLYAAASGKYTGIRISATYLFMTIQVATSSMLIFSDSENQYKIVIGSGLSVTVTVTPLS